MLSMFNYRLTPYFVGQIIIAIGINVIICVIPGHLIIPFFILGLFNLFLTGWVYYLVLREDKSPIISVVENHISYSDHPWLGVIDSLNGGILELRIKKENDTLYKARYLERKGEVVRLVAMGEGLDFVQAVEQVESRLRKNG